LAGKKACVSLSFSRDGKYLAVASDQEAQVWDLAAAKATDLGRSAFRLCFSPVVNRLALFTNFDDLLRVHDVASRADLEGTGAIAWCGMIWSMAFSPDGQTLAVGDHLGAVNVYDTATWKPIESPIEHGHRNANLALAVSPDGTTLLSSGADNTLRRWDLATPDKHLLFQQHNSPFLVFSPSGEAFATGGPVRPVTLWDAAATSQAPALPLKLNTFVFSPDGNLFAGQGTFFDDIVHLWDTQLGREVHRFSFVGGGAGLAMSADGRLLAAGSQQGKVAVWNVASGKEVASWNDLRTDSLAFQPDGTMLAIGHHDGTITFRGTADWQKLRTLRAHVGPVSSLKFTPDGQSLLSSGVDGFVAVRNPEHERARLIVPVGPKGVPVTFDLDRSGQYLFASGPTNAIYVHRLSPVDQAQQTEKGDQQ
jgi:WD40 repeat protein